MKISVNKLSDFIIISFIFLLGFYFYSIDELDLGRYYTSVAISFKNFNFLEFISITILNNIDFIYPSILYITLYLGLPIQLVTGIFVSLYYYLIISILNNNLIKKNYLILIISLISIAPLLYIISISRNATALVFFILFIKYHIKKNKKKSVLFAILSIFTHISMSLYVIIYFLGLFLKKILQNNHKLFNHVISVSPLLIVVGSIVFNYFSILFFTYSGIEDLRYSSYSELSSRMFSLRDINFYIIHIQLISTYILLLLSNKMNLSRILLFTYFAFYLIFYNVSLMMLQRLSMLIPFFYILYCHDIYLENKKIKVIIFILGLVSMIIQLLTIYIYKDAFFGYL